MGFYFRSTGASQRELVDNMLNQRVFNSTRVKEVLLQVDRGHFTNITPYADYPQRIGYGATISAPHMVSQTKWYT